jgi:glycosyltransferase involved in cell wall biosynthesis
MEKAAMRIVQLTPGSGDNFYCENCLRDVALVQAMRALGHEVTFVPMYLPLQIRNPDPIQAAPVFFGGINVYLQQKFSLFRKIPRWVDRWLDSPVLLRMIAGLSHMTTARDLRETTLSMLSGKDGRQEKEIGRLIDWLAGVDERPDTIVLSNALLSGLAKPLRQKLNRPIVCLLQDEDGFLDGLGQPWSEHAWQLLHNNAEDIDHFLSVSRYYRNVMIERAALKPDKISVIPAGVDINEFSPTPELPENPVIGYMARICEDNGLDILVNAIYMLQRDDRFQNIRLKITGGNLQTDERFLRKVKGRIDSLHLTDNISFIPDYSRQSRIDFLKSLSVITVPVRRPMAYGLFALEAMACSVPFVQPATGVFSELAEYGGGVLYDPNNPVHLAETLRNVLSDTSRLKQLRTAARRTAETVFAIRKSAQDMAECFSRLER